MNEPLKSELLEKLADLCHEQWAGWMRYLFRYGKFNNDGTFTMDADKVERWKRQMETPYDRLPTKEQLSDQIEASKFHSVVYEHFKWAVRHMEQTQQNFHLRADAYREMGLTGVASSLESYSWSIYSIARTMLHDVRIGGESDRSSDL